MKAIIDICGTLYDSNTTFDFLDNYIKNWKYILFRRISSNKIWKFINKISILLCKKDITRSIAVSFLNGVPIKELSLAASEFYRTYLINKKRDEVWHVIEQLSIDFELILVSATLDFIASEISKHIAIDQVFSTQLHYDENGNCKGTIKVDLLGNKLHMLIRSGIMPPYHVIITDNLSDVDLIGETQRCVIISEYEKVSKWNKIMKNKSNFELIIV